MGWTRTCYKVTAALLGVGTATVASCSGAKDGTGNPKAVSAARPVVRVALVPRAPLAPGPAVSFGKLPAEAPRSQHLDTLQNSKLELSDPEIATLRRQSFVVSKARRFPTFSHGYVDIYANDLPVFVSADSILEPVHRSYRTILRQFEEAVLVPQITTLITDMRRELGRGAARAFGAETEADIDVYLAVPLGLLTRSPVTMVGGGDALAVRVLTAEATAASGISSGTLFGDPREMDFSQYKPRGHYAENPTLEGYFRCMMWFGREDARVVAKELQPRSLRAMLAMRTLLDGESLKRWTALDHALDAFVGKRDSMSFPEIDRLLADVGASDPAAAMALSDDKWLNAFASGGYGSQRIGSSLRRESLTGRPAPLPRAFSPFGQRFVIDSEVFGNLVYDKLPEGAGPPRLLPKPLDVAYAVLGNGEARALLGQEIGRFDGLAQALDSERRRVDESAPSFWHENLYNSWLFSLRALSPGAKGTDGLPSVARTEPWARRILNTQLASWAELRHNTVLYAKQSYTVELGCSFPDAYVDPYPDFYSALGEFARRGKEITAGFSTGPGGARSKGLNEYFDRLGSIASVLGDMAQRELRGEELTKADLTFVNQAVQIERHEENHVCTQVTIEKLKGWYARLFYDEHDALLYEPTIVDVHTQPTDEVGNPVGKVLHVGTGKPTLMAVTVDTCKGPSTYVGLASSYYEEITSNFQRLTDEDWKGRVDSRAPPSWLGPIYGEL